MSTIAAEVYQPQDLDERQRNELAEIERMLLYVTDDSHYCEEKGCTLETPMCRGRTAEAAVKRLTAVLEPRLIGRHPQRLMGAERIYVEEWRKENERLGHVNSGYTLLEWILCPSDQKPSRISQHDAEIATTVIQWLGTNCGLCFVQKCERRAESERQAYSHFQVAARKLVNPDVQGLERIAELIARKHRPDGKDYLLKQDILDALKMVRSQERINAMEAPR